MKLLHIDLSILGPGSVSRALSAQIVAHEQLRAPGLSVTYRDLAADPVGHLSSAHLAAFQGAAQKRLRFRPMSLQVRRRLRNFSRRTSL